MPFSTATLQDRFSGLADVRLYPGALLQQYTRFGVGGPAEMLLETDRVAAFLQALDIARQSGIPFLVIGGGTNLVVADEGYPGMVLRFLGTAIHTDGQTIQVEAGAVLQDLVDASIRAGLEGLHTMTGIPGSVGAAIYGNAGAYGHSISEFVEQVRYYDGTQIAERTHAECQFHYRESLFKKQKSWVILSALLRLPFGDRDALQAASDKIRATRDAKYPPTMKCAGSIFKNLLLANLPSPVQERVPGKVIIEGKVPAAYFLEAVGAKGMRRGDIHVADYHANLIYNAGQGTARDLVAMINELKTRVHDEFGIWLEEEVQYVGLDPQRYGAVGF